MNSSWQENLEANSTKLIKGSYSNEAVTIYDYVFSFLDYAMKFLDIREHVLNYLAIRDPQSNTSLAVSKYGCFTANFNELPPPIPMEVLGSR